ncbi:MAG: hypothetical protein U0U67_06080 [Chitinophagales bacterium]
MKTITNITAIIIVFMTTFSTSYAKIRKMSAEQFDRIYKHTDKDVVGTWEKVTDYTSKKEEYTQFNANGTYISFEKKDGKYTVTGRGKWMVEGQAIYIMHGSEKEAAVAYSVQNNQLIFDAAQYTKPASTFASK